MHSCGIKFNAWQCYCYLIVFVYAARYTMYRDMTIYFVLLQEGRTPLHTAAEYNGVDCLKYLLDKGANIDSKDMVRQLMCILKYYGYGITMAHTVPPK